MTTTKGTTMTTKLRIVRLLRKAGIAQQTFVRFAPRSSAGMTTPGWYIEEHDDYLLIAHTRFNTLSPQFTAPERTTSLYAECVAWVNSMTELLTTAGYAPVTVTVQHRFGAMQQHKTDAFAGIKISK